MKVMKMMLLLVMMLIIAVTSFAQITPSTEQVDNRILIRVATGGVNGNYNKFWGQEFARILNGHPKYKVEILTTNGSVENLDLMEQGKAELAIVQADVYAFKNPSNVMYVTGGIDEWIHLVMKVDSAKSIRKFAKGSSLAVDKIGSGAYTSFQMMCRVDKWYKENIVPVEIGGARALSSLESGEVQGWIFVSSKGGLVIADLAKKADKFVLAPFDDGTFVKVEHNKKRLYQKDTICENDTQDGSYESLVPGGWIGNACIDTYKMTSSIVISTSFSDKNVDAFDVVYNAANAATSLAKQKLGQE